MTLEKVIKIETLSQIKRNWWKRPGLWATKFYVSCNLIK